MDYAVVGAPLSDRFRAQFERLVGASPHYLGFDELRRLSLPQLVKRLIGLGANRLFLVLEAESSRALLPVYFGLAALASAREIRLVLPNLRSEPVSRFRALAALAAAGQATLAGQFCLRRCRRETAALLAQPRLDLPRPKSGTVLYLKSTLTTGAKAGGSLGHMAGVANALVNRGYAVDFAGLEAPAALDANIHSVALQPPGTFGLPADLNLYRFHEAMVQQLLTVARQRPYTFIYQRLSVGNYAGAVLSRKLRIPLVLEYNGSEVWISKNWTGALRHADLALRAEETLLKHAHLIVTVSQVLADEVVARGIERRRVVWYPNCVDPRLYDAARFTPTDSANVRQKLGIPADAVVAAFVGTFGPWHGAEVLARAIRDMSVDSADWLRAQRLHFVFVGDGPNMPLVRQTLADEKCRPFYTLAGVVPQKETPAYLAASDVLVSPHVPNVDGSRFFGSPTKLFEYMAMGRAILASDLEQIGEVLAGSLRVDHLPDAPPTAEDLAPALLTTPGHSAGLIRGLRFLVEQPAWRAALGANAKKQALARYTWDRHVDEILGRLLEL